MSSGTVQTAQYWNSYYKDFELKIAAPSQFAAFMQGELADEDVIVDFGCGSGRDSLFFASLGRTVVGADASSAAVEACRAKADNAGMRNVEFVCGDVADDALYEKIGARFAGSAKPLIYARFFLHAIDEQAQAHFLRNAARLVGHGRIAVEFRTNKDKDLHKITPNHYRRFIDPVVFIRDAFSFGLQPEYFVEGFGYAKYRDDDAHVARIVLRGGQK
jgi:SAM-dependent methyltransferase